MTCLGIFTILCKPLKLHILEPLYSKALRNIITMCLFHILLVRRRASWWLICYILQISTREKKAPLPVATTEILLLDDVRI
jgi:hypothetical protein